MNIQDHEWINARQIHLPPKKSLKPPLDKEVSKLVGRNIYAHDPKLLQLVGKWKRINEDKRRRGRLDEFANDNLMENAEFIKELKETYGCG